MKINQLLERFKGVTPAGTGNWKVLCPCHRDHKPSLAISLGEDGRIILHCHAGCETAAILRDIHLGFEDLFDSGSPTVRSKGRVVSHATLVTRDKAYNVFLQSLDMLAEHQTDLLGRGLSSEQIARNQYKSLTLEGCKEGVRRLRESGFNLLEIPGFTKDQTGAIRTVRTDGLVIPVRTHEGLIQALQIRTEDEDGKYKWFSTADVSTGSVCHHPLACCSVPNQAVIRLVEGPLKADVVMALDPYMPTLGFPGITTWESAVSSMQGWGLHPGSTEGVKPEVRLCFDADWHEKPTVRFELHKAFTELTKAGFKVEVYDWNEEDGKGLDDLLKNGKHPTLLGDVDEQTRPTLEEEFPESANLIVVKLEDVQEAETQWLWPGWLPYGAFCTLDGDPGEGKSTFVSALAVHLAMGTSGIPGSMPVLPKRSLIMACEDPRETTWKPRLMAAGLQNQSMIRFWDGKLDEKKRRWLPAIPQDIRALEYLIRSQDAGLVVIDPLFSFIDSKYDSFKSQHMQQVLNELADLATRTKSCILGIRHFNKAIGLSALYRGSGSISIVGVARSGLAIVRDDDDEAIRYLAQSKTNNGELQQPIRFHIENQGQSRSRSFIVWDGIEQRSLKELTASKEKTSEPVSQKATVLLVNMLQDKEVPATTIYRAAERLGISEKTLKRTKKNLGIEAYREDNQWLWRFPHVGQECGDSKTCGEAGSCEIAGDSGSPS